MTNKLNFQRKIDETFDFSYFTLQFTIGRYSSFSEMNLPNLLKRLLFTQNTSNLFQNIHNIDLRHSRMK